MAFPWQDSYGDETKEDSLHILIMHQQPILRAVLTGPTVCTKHTVQMDPFIQG